MKKVMFYAPKDIRVEESEIPIPGQGEIVIKNKVSLTCGTDVKIYMRGYRWDPPFSFGHEASGVVYAVGENVEKFKVGDRVVAHNSVPCHECYYCKKAQHSLCENPIFNKGAFTEYQLIPERIVRQNTFLIPAEMSFKQAALLEPFSCAVYGASEVPIELGDTVAVNGCGPIGLMFVRLCHLRGARVIACDKSPERLEMAKKLGAAHTVNISEAEDQAQAVRELTEKKRGVDVAIEAVGLSKVWSIALNMVRAGGTVLCFGGTPKGETVEVDTTLLHYSQITMKGVFHTTPRHVNAAFELLKMGAIREEDFVNNEYPIERIEEAILEHSRGKVIKNCIVYK
ncbi:MAG: zinc-binding dehydrogenase [Eubacteriaceae bacterium]|nr:zinc-binding dehydrogenase [Eubacteriaceae bacterium]